jgi:UDP-N-acetylglucosamine 2-epimerase (non-hydrolysing)
VPRTPTSILHVSGARPNFMKVAPVMRAFAARPGVQQWLVHTGQHYDDQMSRVFFEELGIAPADEDLGVGSGPHGWQTGQVMIRIEPVLLARKPSWVLVYGDVNSTMAAALTAAKLRIRVAHVEAGLRSYDREMPEELNRVVTDHAADRLLTPSADADENLAREGIPAERIHRVGNVMIDTLAHCLPRARERNFHGGLGLGAGEYVYVTLHRPSNVDEPEMLAKVAEALRTVADSVPIAFPVHPRTRQRLADTGVLERLSGHPGVRLLGPVGYLDSICLAEAAGCVLTDSGGLQEETTFLGIPCLTLRPNTERPVTISEGSNRLTTVERVPADVEQAMRLRREGHRFPRPELWDGSASERICDDILGR